MNTIQITPIQRIFRRLAGTYVSEWDRSIGEVPLEDIILLWEYELSGYLQSASGNKAITWALNNLPERCPNIISFKALCRRVPANTFQTLSEPPADPAVIAGALSKMRSINLTFDKSDPLDWARRIVSRSDAGEKINYRPLKLAYETLGLDSRKLAIKIDR